MRIRTSVWGSVAILVAACGREQTEPVGHTAEALSGSTTCALGASCSLVMKYPSQLVVGDSAVDLPIAASESLVIADRVQLEDKNGNLATVADSGESTTNTNVTLGAQSRVGGLWTRGSVQLNSYAYVGGPAWVGGSVQKQDGASVAGSISPPTSGVAEVHLSAVFPTTDANNIALEPDHALSITGGRYGDVAVKSRSVLTLTTGTYYFDSLDLEPQSILKLDNSAGTIVIYIRGTLIYRGSVSFVGATSDVFVASFSSEDISIEAGFNGTLLAPNARIVLGTANGATHQGAFFGKNVEVQAGAKVHYAPVTGTGAAFESLDMSGEGDPTMTPPPTPLADGSSFIEYNQRVATYIKTLIDQKYTGKLVEIAAHPSASGAQDTSQNPSSSGTLNAPPASTVTAIPLPATMYGDFAAATADAQASRDSAIAAAIVNYPEIDSTKPVSPILADLPASTWASGFCPLEKPVTTIDAEPEDRISEEFFYGNTPDRTQLFDAYWNASGAFKAGLNSLYLPYAQAMFSTSVGASVHMPPIYDSVIPLLSINANAEAGSIENDGRLLSVPSLRVNVALLNKTVVDQQFPEVSKGTLACRDELNDCQKRGGVFDQCCGRWYSPNIANKPIVNLETCITNDPEGYCSTSVPACKKALAQAATCVASWSPMTEPWKVDLWHNSIDFLDPPLTYSTGIFTVTFNGGMEVGIPSYFALDETGPDITIAPFGRVFAKATASVGLIGIYVGVEGQLDLLKLDVPFKGSVKWVKDTTPENCQMTLKSNSQVETKWSTLNGRIYLTVYTRIITPWKTYYLEIARQQILSKDGFSVTTPPWVLAQAENPIVKLDPSACLLGGASCANIATATAVLAAPGDLPAMGKTVYIPAPYGQKSCEGQAIVEVGDQALEGSYGLFVHSTWSSTVKADCSALHSQAVIWVQRDHGKNGDAVTSSTYYGWEKYDSLVVTGVPGSGGSCIPVATREVELPASIKERYGSEATSFLNLNRMASSNRVTAVRVVVQSTANCTEQPLSVVLTPTTVIPN